MDLSWLGKLLVPLTVALAFVAFRKYFPAKVNTNFDRYDRSEGKRLPTGAFRTIAITMGLGIAIGGYFALRIINPLFAKLDGLPLAQAFPITAIWYFLPGFAALAVPWPLMISLLRRSAYSDEARYIEAEASEKSGFDCFRVMGAINLFLVLPIAVFTLLTLPERLTLTNTNILWTHYASLQPEVFSYSDIIRLTIVDGYKLRDGSFKTHKDLLIEFKDGRRLGANAVGDGGSEPSTKVIQVVLDKTGLAPDEVRTEDEIHQ